MQKVKAEDMTQLDMLTTRKQEIQANDIAAHSPLTPSQPGHSHLDDLARGVPRPEDWIQKEHEAVAYVLRQLLVNQVLHFRAPAREDQRAKKKGRGKGRSKIRAKKKGRGKGRAGEGSGGGYKAPASLTL